MKKRLEKYGVEIATSIGEHSGFDGVHQYWHEGRFFCCDDYRLLETETAIDALDLKTDSRMAGTMAKHISLMNDPDYDYTIHTLPSVSEIKEGIRSVCGRKLDRVAWSDGELTMNARWLYKTMEALHATVCYVSKAKAHQPVFFFEDDDLTSMNRCMVMPIFGKEGKTGFWNADGRYV